MMIYQILYFYSQISLNPGGGGFSINPNVKGEKKITPIRKLWGEMKTQVS